MQSNGSMPELVEAFKPPYKMMFMFMRRLRANLYLIGLTLELKGVVELAEAYVTAGKR